LEYPTSTVAMNPEKTMMPETQILKIPHFSATATERAANTMGVV